MKRNSSGPAHFNLHPKTLTGTNLKISETEPKIYKYFLGLNFFYPKEPELKRMDPNRASLEKNQPEYTRPDKNRFVPDLKTCIYKLRFFCVLLYILFYD